MADRPIPLTVIVLTCNEDKNIERCLQSLYGWTDEIFLVDSGSTDETLSIARQYGVREVHHPFENHTLQWTWALAHLPCAHDWVMGLDADHRVTPELRDELIDLFTRRQAHLGELEGLYVKRRQFFRGAWIRHGGYYPKYLLKLFRREKVYTDPDDLVDHHFYINGRVDKLRYDIIEENIKEDDISFWTEKHNRYASLIAQEELRCRRAPLDPSVFGTPDQRILWLRQCWKKLPLYFRPFLYFLYRYIIRLGFLDGKQGFIFHFLQGFWFRLLVDINIDEQKSRRKA